MSHLRFISKLIEKVVAKQLNSYINGEGFFNVSQSAYRRLHSTETACLKNQNDIPASMGSGKAVAGPHSNIIDHNIFLTASGIGLGLMALCWGGSNPILQTANRS